MDSQEERETRKDLEEILHRVDQLPVIDWRHAEEIIGFDEHGIPTCS